MRICDDLRQAVLQAAIQGKLTKQLPEDGNAVDLLTHITAEKARLIKEGKIKKEKALPAISADEITFDIPGNWKWVKLGELCSKIGSGNTPSGGKNSDVYIENGVKFIRSMNVYNDGLHDQGIVYISEELANTRVGTLVYAKDILLNITGGSIGRCALVPDCFDLGSVNQHVLIIRNICDAIRHYIHMCICSPLVQEIILKKAVGDKVGFSAEKAKNLLMPLPPLAEQHRIVTRVEELMARIDDLEKTETELEKLKAAFPGDMKAALLQAAIQGKLTEQLPEDGEAADLINQIAKEKSQLIKEGKIKKEKPLPEITPEEVPFDIPENWQWVRLGSITYNRWKKNPDRDFTYIDIGSIDNKVNKLGDLTNILSPNQAPSRARKIVRNGDIIYATVRPYLHNTCIIDRDILPEPIVSTGFAVLSATKGIYNRYLFRCLLSPMFDEYANSNENAKGVAYPAINDAKLMAAYIPLPPLAEQKRIVEKLDKLLTLCDGLVEE